MLPKAQAKLQILNKTHLIILLLTLLLGLSVVKINKLESDNKIFKVSLDNSLNTKEIISTDDCSVPFEPCKAFPWLNIPIKYFSDKDIQWSDNKQKSFDDKAVYQSYPTTNITIKEYSTDIKPLSSIKFAEVIKKIRETETVYGVKMAEDNYRDYGQLAVHFLSEYLVIEGSDDFDVDADGKKENIVTVNSLGRADGGSYTSAIIKDNKIIFSVDEDNSSIVPADTTNGFYVEWRNPNDISPRCCEKGYIRTRFVWENNKFVPIYEQEVRYVVVGIKS
jgi:hypothetical protein